MIHSLDANGFKRETHFTCEPSAVHFSFFNSQTGDLDSMAFCVITSVCILILFE